MDLGQVDKDVQNAINESFEGQQAFTEFLNKMSSIQLEVKLLEKEIKDFDLALKRKMDSICSQVAATAKIFSGRLCSDLTNKLNEISTAMQPSQEELAQAKNLTKMASPLSKKDSIGGVKDLRTVIDEMNNRKSDISKEWKLSKSNLKDLNSKLKNSISKKGSTDVETQHNLNTLNGFINHSYNGSLIECFSAVKKDAAESTNQGIEQVAQIIKNVIGSVDQNVGAAIENSGECQKRISQALKAIDNFNVKEAQKKATGLLMNIQIEKLPNQTSSAKTTSLNDKLSMNTGDAESSSKNDSLSSKKHRSHKSKKEAEKEDQQQQQPLPDNMPKIVELIDVMENETATKTDAVLKYITRLKNQANVLLSDDRLHFEMSTIQSYKADDEAALSVKKGEPVSVLSREQNGWVLVRMGKSKAEGFIPLFCLRA